MTTAQRKQITVETTINAPVEKVWDMLNDPKHITQWNTAIDTWHCPNAENDLRPGGKLKSRMEAKDGSFGFDFEATYDEVRPHEFISYTLGDGRKVDIHFKGDDKQTTLTETFDAENENPADMQRDGWQAILNNFKKYVEMNNKAIAQKLHFEVSINAPVEKVYTMMLGEGTFEQWTAEFNPTSTVKGSWDKGSKILFIGTDEHGNAGGMVSRIRENIPNEYVSIEHLGIIQGDQEITSGPEVDDWAGAQENYTFKPSNGGTLLEVDMDSNEQFASYFQETWPKALNKLKAMCEA